MDRRGHWLRHSPRECQFTVSFQENAGYELETFVAMLAERRCHGHGVSLVKLCVDATVAASMPLLRDFSSGEAHEEIEELCVVPSVTAWCPSFADDGTG